MNVPYHSIWLTLLLTLLFSVPRTLSQTIAVNDTIDMVPGIPKTVNLLANDTYPAGDSIRVTGGMGAGSGAVISTWHYQGMFTYYIPYRGVGQMVTGSYTILNLSASQSSMAHMVFRIRDKSYDTLQINDVAATFTASGFHFILPHLPAYSLGYFVPKGSGTGTIFANSFWIGGLDESDSLHLAAERFRQGPLYSPAGTKPDFYAGPVMDSASYSLHTDTTWNYIWNLKKTDVDHHKAHWHDAGYQPIHDIRTWPGNGDVSLGQAAQLAPFYDANGDGIYNPFEGDCPAIRGDQALFFIFNDDRADHLETRGKKLKAEIHGMAYAFNMPGDSAFSKTVFLNYRVFNRSTHSYRETYMGTFSDLEVGFAQDDYLLCDVGRGSFIGYNGKPVDGTGQPREYGAHPPAQSVTLLAGPKMEPIGSDRPRYDNLGHPICDESTNGYGFGDGIAGNERMGLSSFIHFYYSNMSNPPYNDQPVTPGQYYNYLKSIWIDGTSMVYGGHGHLDYGGYGPQARFMFPGESDTLNWGCGCQPPNGPVNWTEVTAGNLPHDISGMGATGPITFRPGETQEFDLAFVWARDYTSGDTLASVIKLRTMIDTVRKAFYTNRLPGGGAFLATPEISNSNSSGCNIYPNPASTEVTIDFILPLKGQTTLEIFDLTGKLMKVVSIRKGITKYRMDVSGYSPGLYLFHTKSTDGHLMKKLSVIH